MKSLAKFYSADRRRFWSSVYPHDSMQPCVPGYPPRSRVRSVRRGASHFGHRARCLSQHLCCHRPRNVSCIPKHCNHPLPRSAVTVCVLGVSRFALMLDPFPQLEQQTGRTRRADRPQHRRAPRLAPRTVAPGRDLPTGPSLLADRQAVCHGRLSRGLRGSFCGHDHPEEGRRALV